VSSRTSSREAEDGISGTSERNRISALLWRENSQVGGTEDVGVEVSRCPVGGIVRAEVSTSRFAPAAVVGSDGVAGALGVSMAVG
jgi:hypothetical protein